MLASATHIPIRYFSGSRASSRVQPGGQFLESSGPGGPPPGSEAPPSPGLIPISVVSVVGIFDCGFQIADFGFTRSNGGAANPQSEIRNPKFLQSPCTSDGPASVCIK